jgi:hypothetical protein
MISAEEMIDKGKNPADLTQTRSTSGRHEIGPARAGGRREGDREGLWDVTGISAEGIDFESGQSLVSMSGSGLNRHQEYRCRRPRCPMVMVDTRSGPPEFLGPLRVMAGAADGFGRPGEECKSWRLLGLRTQGPQARSRAHQAGVRHARAGPRGAHRPEDPEGQDRQAPGRARVRHRADVAEALAGQAGMEYRRPRGVRDPRGGDRRDPGRERHAYGVVPIEYEPGRKS